MCKSEKNIPLANTAAGLMVSKVNSQNSLSSVTRSQSWKMLKCKSEIYIIITINYYVCHITI